MSSLLPKNLQSIVVNNMTTSTSIITPLISTSNLITSNATIPTILMTGSLYATHTNNTIANIFTTNGNVGINTTSPGSRLEVNGTMKTGDITVGNINFTGSLFQNGSAYLGSQWTTTSGNTLTYTSGSINVNSGFTSSFNSNTLGNIFTTGGNIGFGTTSPNNRLDVSGTARITTSLTTGSLFSSNQTTTNIVATNLSSGTLNSNTIATSVLTTGTLFSANQTTTNIVGTNLSTGTLSSTTIATTVLTSTTISTGSLFSSNQTTNNIVGTNITTSSINLTNGSLAATFNSHTIGNILTTGGNVGIGVIPSSTLSIGGGAQIGGQNSIISQGAHIQWNRSAGEGETWIINQKGLALANAGIRFGTSTTTSNVTEWMRIIDNGNVGIKTTNPTQLLDVNGNISLSDTGNGKLFLGNSTSGSARLNIRDIFQQLIEFQYLTNTIGNITSFAGIPGLLFNGGGGTTQLVLASTGNIGIGITSPSYSIDINGSLRASSGILLSSSNVFEFGHGVSGKHADAGKIGYNTWATGLNIIGAGTASGSRLVYVYDHLRVETSSTIPTLNITSAANITGTTSIQATTTNYSLTSGSLNVSGDIVLSGTELMFTTTGVGAPVMNGRGSGSKIVIFPETNITKGDYSIGIESAYMWFQVPNINYSGYKFYQGTTTSLIMTPAGNIGIGTTAPNVKLDVRDGSGYFGNFTGFNSGAAALLTFVTGGKLCVSSGVNGLPATTGTNGNAIAFRIRGGDNATLDFGANSTNTWLQATDFSSGYNNNYHIHLNPNGGNVAIGNGGSTPSYKLDVSGDVRANSLIVNGSGTYTYGTIYRDSNWGMLFRSGTNNPPLATFSFADYNDNKLMTIDSRGNVGIGTISPAYKLEVNGVIKNNADIVIDSSSRLTLYNPTGPLQIRSGSSNMLHFNQDNTGNISMGVGGGNVGIATTSPGYRLEINGNCKVTSDLYVGNAGGVGTIYMGGGAPGDGSYDHSVIETRNYTSSESTEMLLFKGNDVAGASGPDRIRLRAATIAFDTYSGATSDRTSESIRMFINGSGDVGINTVSPGFKLHVNGNMRADEIYNGGWFRNYGDTGLYNQDYQCHFIRNDAQYGNWRIWGNAVNNWNGLRFTQAEISLMAGDGATKTSGFHYNGVGWGLMVDASRNLYIPGDITAYWSDRRLKTNLRQLSHFDHVLNSLTGYTFNWNEKGQQIINKPADYEEVGLIAQDVQAVIPQAVKVNKAGVSIDDTPDSFDYLTINYDKIVPFLVEGYKAQRHEIHDLKSKVAKLEEIVQQLLNR